MSHPHRRPPLLAALGLAALAGCVPPPARVALDPGRTAQVRRIAVYRIAEPTPAVYTLGGAARAFGALGSMVQGSNNADDSAAYGRLVRQGQVAFAPRLQRAMEAALAGDGYEAVALAKRVPLKADGREVDLGALGADADAALVVTFPIVGYVSPPDQDPYQPWVVVRARLVEPRSREILYDRTFAAGYAQPQLRPDVPSDPRYRYDGIDALTARFPESVQGIDEVIRTIAARLGADLARGG
jgi:hypothetical protein